MCYSKMIDQGRLFGLFIILCLCSCTARKAGLINPATVNKIQFWLTTADQSALLTPQKAGLTFTKAQSNFPTIEVNDQQTYQTMDGFGFTLTGGSASLINKLPAAEKDSLLKELFSTAGKGIGINYLRLSIGASDLSAAPFTYNDLPAGATDLTQDKFSISPEKTDLIPVLKKILTINPQLKILGTPWSAPLWMKDHYSFKGGSLKHEYFQSYARYFVKYLAAMKAEGIAIDAITIQNEPLHPGNVPSMYMTAKDQAQFIKTALGPMFKQEGLNTKIILYDHNADRPDYPISILDDLDAKKYVDGTAFHLYGGSIDALSKVHDAHPDKNIYFTEQWVGGPGNFAEDLKWHISTLIIGATRNWSRNVLEWNLAADASYGPHTHGGCTSCLGALTISPKVTRNVAYYIIGHASKFIPANSIRIYSNIMTNLPNVAFKTPDGRKVLIIMNKYSTDQSFSVKDNGRFFNASLPSGAVATFIW